MYRYLGLVFVFITFSIISCDKEIVDKEIVDKDPVEREKVDKDPVEREKVAVKFALKNANKISRKLASNGEVAIADDMRYSVFAFVKNTESFAGRVDVIVGNENASKLWLEEGLEYIFVAFSDNSKSSWELGEIDELLGSEAQYITSGEFSYRHTHFNILEYNTDLKSMILDKMFMRITNINNETGEGYIPITTNRPYYYQRIDDYGPIASNSNPTISLDLKMVNFGLTVVVDASALDHTRMNTNNIFKLESAYAVSGSSNFFRLYDGSFFLDPAAGNSLQSNDATSQFVGFEDVYEFKCYTFMTKEDPAGQLKFGLNLHKTGNVDNYQQIEIKNLKFTPGKHYVLRITLKPGIAISPINVRYEYEELTEKEEEAYWHP